MKDILLINMFSKNESSYTDYYIEEIKKEGLSYDSVYFERYKMDAEAEENELLFKEYCPTGGNKFKKIGTMLRYASFIRSIVKKHQYKKIIVFTTVPAIMLYDLLTGQYRKKYILDIRDYTHENNKAYFSLEKKLIDCAFAAVISSKGFLRFLPSENRYYVTHNIARENPENYPAKEIDRSNVHIGFVGSIRYYEENAELIRQFANKEGYQLDYYGTFSQNCNLPEFCKENNIRNAVFYGRFNNSEKKDIYKSIDVINSIYGVKGLETTTAVPNRLYDAAIYKCPIIVSDNTYLAEIVNQYQLGFSADVHRDNIPEKLENFLKSYNADQFEKNCNLFLQEVYNDMALQKEMIRSFIKDDIK